MRHEVTLLLVGAKSGDFVLRDSISFEWRKSESMQKSTTMKFYSCRIEMNSNEYLKHDRVKLLLPSVGFSQSEKIEK